MASFRLTGCIQHRVCRKPGCIQFKRVLNLTGLRQAPNVSGNFMKVSLCAVLFCISYLSCKRPYNKSSVDSAKSEISKTSYMVEIPKQIDSTVVDFWNEFIVVAQKHDFRRLRDLSESNILGCGSIITINTFIEKCFFEVFTDSLFFKISDKSNILFPEINSFTKKRVHVSMLDYSPDGPWTMTFDFIKRGAGYRFHAVDSFGGPKCCR
jgi:hypothetical protein